jgi:4,5-dihydroxyphthalate decarboxylase
LSDISLTLACGAYDHMEALSRGIVRANGIEVTFLPMQSPPEIFARMIKTNAFDISEMSLAMYFTLRARGSFPYIALPVFPARVFRHAYIFVNRERGIAAPKDLEGQCIGVQQYRQTAATWIRGILQHEYGMDFSRCSWIEGGVNVARAPDDDMDLRPSRPIDIQSTPPGKSINDLLLAGEVAAYFGARTPKAFRSHPAIVRLFPDYRKVEREFYQRSGIHPIMHTLVMREALHREKPWIAENIVEACEASKQWALSQMRFSGTMRYMLPWMNDDIEEIDALFGKDPYPYGIAANRRTLETLMTYLVDQHFVAGPQPEIEGFFTPVVSWAE